MGGETAMGDDQAAAEMGLSPRGRGNPPSVVALRGGHGSIPAWAGKPVSASTWPRRHAVYPRVGGETGIDPSRMHDPAGLSPRGRGNRRPPAGTAGSTRSIPAWAGKP